MKARQNLLTCATILLLFSSQGTALAAVSAVNERGLSAATAHVNNGNYATAYKHFLRMAQHGCPYSQCIVGIMYQKGIGVKKDAQEAMRWFEKSAAQGFPDAEHRLGKIHLDGQDVARDTDVAAQWLEKAARHGEVEAQYELGKLDVTERSSKALKEGRAWLQEAASHGYAQAKELAEKLPPLPGGNAPVASNRAAQGFSNLQTSWVGYGSVVKSLEATTSQ